jgi:2-polyprenyl-6-methoxyphenol hydroxylase-like FAD-dependent oxidoreductase
MTTPSVLIVGAGLGGAALAHGLLAAGVDVRIVERDSGPDARPQGFRISVDGTGRAALRSLLPPDRTALLDGLEAADVGSGFAMATGTKRPLMRFGGGAATLRRPGLRRLLVDGLPVEWDRGLSSYADVDGRVEARFTDGTSAVADLLVGCDGVGSAVRAGMRGVDVPVVATTDVRSIGGSVARTPAWDAALPLNREGAVQYLGPGGQALFVSFCERDDGTPTVLWALSSRTAAEPVPDDLPGACSAALAHPGWHPDLRALVDATGEQDVIAPITFATTTLRATPRGPWWPSARVTLLGDAAHAMPPLRGLGGNTAFADATLLDRLLRTGRPVPEIVAEYERDVARRGAKAVEETGETVHLCHFRNPAAVALRTLALRAAGLRRPRAA